MHPKIIIPKNILQTIAYFDLFDYPLTPFEVWKWLWRDDGEAVSYGAVVETLENDATLRARLVWHDGLVCLKGREAIFKIRQERQRVAIMKYDLARRAIRLLEYLPGVLGIAVCNSLGFRNARPESDIDFFIITDTGATWVVRFMAAGLMQLLGWRPSPRRVANGMCLSFFVSRRALNLEPLAIAGGDPHFRYWITQFTPLYGRGGIWDDFWRANAWVRETIPNALGPSGGAPWHFQDREHAPWRWLTPAARAVDRLAGQWQRQRLPQRLTAAAARGGTAVVVTDDVLKFHDNDRREECRERWQKAIATLQ